jgi:hypothetical protein
MKLSAKLLALVLVIAPAAPALAATPAAAPTPVPAVVARYSFDKGVVGGYIAEDSGHVGPLRVRSASNGALRVGVRNGGKYVGFPARCVPGAAACARILLEAANDPDLNPGLRQFRFGASIYLQKWQLNGSPNVLQKGVAGLGSQYKLQLGASQGKAQCVVVGIGAATSYLARSDISVADGAWHQVTCLRTLGFLAIVVDGRQRSRVVVPDALQISNTLPLRVGAANFTTLTDRYTGYLDDVFVALG